MVRPFFTGLSVWIAGGFYPPLHTRCRFGAKQNASPLRKFRGETVKSHGSTLLTALAVARVLCNGRARSGLLPEGVRRTAQEWFRRLAAQGTHSQGTPLCPPRRSSVSINAFPWATIARKCPPVKRCRRSSFYETGKRPRAVPAYFPAYF